MKAYQVLENGTPLAERELDMLIPSGNAVVRKSVASGVCPSDSHLHDGSFA